LGGMRRLAFHPAILRWMLPETHTTQPTPVGLFDVTKFTGHGAVQKAMDVVTTSPYRLLSG